MKKQLEYKDDTSTKLLEIEAEGEDDGFTVTFGKIGTAGQTLTKKFERDEKRFKKAKKLLNEKLKKGYAYKTTSTKTNVPKKAKTTNIVAEKRKHTSEEFIRKNNIPVYPELPVMIDEDMTNIRSAKEIGRYAIIIHALSLVYNDELSKSDCVDWLRREKLMDDLNIEWTKYLGKSEYIDIILDEDLISPFIFILLWAVKKIDSIPFPVKKFTKKDIALINKCFPKPLESTKAFLESLEVRTTTEILNEADKTGRLFHAIDQTGIDTKERKRLDNIISWIEINGFDVAFCWLLFSSANRDRKDKYTYYYEREFKDRSVQ